MAYFLRKLNRKKGTYLQICNSFRVPGAKHPKQETYKTLGYVDDLTAAGIDDPIAHFTDEVKKLNEKAAQEREAAREAQITTVSKIRHLGFFPLQAVLNRLDVENDILLLFSDRNFESSIYDCLAALVFSRAINPCSKLKTLESVIPNLFGDFKFTYDQLLNYLRALGSHYEKIIEIFTFHTQETYILDTDNVFFDCTNFYFEIDREDDFRRKGPSKENRKDPIVGMGLLLDANTIPVGMKLYPGNQSEQPVLREIIHELKQRNNITGRTVQVADKGLNSARNIIEAVNAGDGYLFSKSVKKLSESDRKWVLDEDGYLEAYDKNEEVKFKLKSCTDTFTYSYTDENRKRITKRVREKRVVTYNPKLASKQLREIDKLVEKARTCALSGAKRQEYGEAARYANIVSQDENGEINGQRAVVTLNEEKIRKDREICGYNLLITSELYLEEREIYDKYHELWRIEETFRCMKSELDARPVYVQDKDKIKGHFLICYIAVLLERLFQYKPLEGKFESRQCYDFIRNFNLVEGSPGRYVNLAVRNELLEFMAQKYRVPVLNCYIRMPQIKRMLELSF